MNLKNKKVIVILSVLFSRKIIHDFDFFCWHKQTTNKQQINKIKMDKNIKKEEEKSL